MPERDALLSAIRANSEDDTPRLVFADWLDENEPDSKSRKKKSTAPSSWAALIRAECELARLQADGSAAAAVYDSCDGPTFYGVRWERVLPEMCRRVELYQAAEALGPKSAKTRRAGLPKAAASGITWGEETHRGFPASVTVTNWKKFVAALPALAASCPRVKIEFDYEVIPTDGAGAVARGLAGWCRELAIEISEPAHAELIVAMSAVPETTGVCGLRIESGNGAETARALAAIADAPNWSGLRSLALSTRWELPAPLAQRLLRVPHLRGLAHVALSNEEPLPVIEALTELPALRALEFEWNSLNDYTAQVLAAAPNLAGLRSLRSTSTNLSGPGIAALLASPHLRNLAVLHVRGGEHTFSAKALAGAPTGGLRVLQFPHCLFSDEAVAALVASPRLSELITLDAGTGLTAERVRLLMNGLANRVPSSLTFHDAKLTANDAKAFAKWPAAANIDVLDIWRTRLSASAAKALATSPYFQQLKYLQATITDKAGWDALKAAFGERVEMQGNF